ncbi:hypothetical protein CRENBAI_017906 [Crenichthys baileyi]|uniref:Uncharacterized protein n=1 Tax=Crenichthys baileyi TaxID=28760 RepID=A0AAV9RD55_9TELE
MDQYSSKELQDRSAGNYCGKFFKLPDTNQILKLIGCSPAVKDLKQDFTQSCHQSKEESFLGLHRQSLGGAKDLGEMGTGVYHLQSSPELQKGDAACTSLPVLARSGFPRPCLQVLTRTSALIQSPLPSIQAPRTNIGWLPPEAPDHQTSAKRTCPLSNNLHPERSYFPRLLTIPSSGGFYLLAL